MAFILGVTGGIGSGKSAATSHFRNLGITIVDADEASRAVVTKGSPALAAIAKRFGNEYLLDSGELNRPLLRERIFSSSDDKQWLETLLHPLIRQRIIEQLQAITSTYGILSSPLLFETRQDQLVQRTLVIDADEELQKQRASLRDGVTAEQIDSIMDNQLPRLERRQLADDIIENNTSLDDLQQKIKDYHQHLLKNFL